MLAVLEDALSTFRRGLRVRSGKSVAAFREVDHWFRSRTFDSPFSFESICSTLRLDSAGVRERLNKMRLEAFEKRHQALAGRRSSSLVVGPGCPQIELPLELPLAGETSEPFLRKLRSEVREGPERGAATHRKLTRIYQLDRSRVPVRPLAQRSAKAS